MNISINHTASFSPTYCLNSNSHLQNPTLCVWGSKKGKRVVLGRNSKLILESACIIASKLGVLPAPLELILREQFGNGGGSGSGSGFGWGGGFFDGWRRKRGGKLRKLGFLILILVCGAGLWFVVREEFYSGGLGLLLFGLSMNGWRRGAKDWILGFFCCAFLVGLLLKREDLKSFWTLNLKKNSRRRRKTRVF